MGHDEYVPFFTRKGEDGEYSIDPTSLKAIRLPKEEVQILRKVASYYGAGNLDTTYKIRSAELRKAAERIFEKITAA